MEETDLPRRRANPEQWFEEGDDYVPPETPPPGNQRRPSPTGWQPPGWLTVTLLGMMIALIVALAYLHDEALPWDGDLAHPATAEDAADNSSPTPAAEDLPPARRMKAMLKAAAALNLSTLGEKPPWDWDTITLGNLLEKHAAVLESFTDLTGGDNAKRWLPSHPGWKTADLGSDPAWPAVLLIKQAEIAYLTHRGEEAAAMEAAMDLVIMGSLLEHLDAWPSFMHRALEIHRGAAQSLAILLENTHLSLEKLTRLQVRELARWKPSGDVLAASLNGYYQFEKKLIMGPEAGDVPLPPGYAPVRSGWLLFKPNATLRLFAENFRELKREAKLVEDTGVNQTNSPAAYRYGELKHAIGGPNASGQLYFVNRFQEYLDLLHQHSDLRARYNIVIALFAVHRYVLKTGQIPQKLDELVPKFLPSKILDPFSGDPLRYRPDRGLIYSIGPGLQDDGGKPGPLPFSDDSEPTAKTGIVAAKVVR